MLYDLIIVGGGPGGVAAGIYAARKKMKTLLITDSFGGQSLVSAGIENWIGDKLLTGFDLATKLEEHLRAQEGIEIVDDTRVAKAEKRADGSFAVTTESGKTFETKYLLLASGSYRKRLDVPGEKELEGKGVVYCSICDAPIFNGKVTAVVGGGNAALEAVIDLLPYATKIHLLVRGEAMRGDPVTQEKIKAHPNVEVHFNTQVKEVFGDHFVDHVQLVDSKTGEERRLDVEGVFVEIGSLPNSAFVKDIVRLNDRGEVVVDHKTQQTSDPGIWAVGDVSDVLYKQNNISVGDGVKATLNIYERLMKETG